MASHPRPSPNIVSWLGQLIGVGHTVLVPEIGDYEVRRELLRAGKTKGVERLDELKARLGYLAITTETMLLAASSGRTPAGKATRRQRTSPLMPT
jgi:hypothetical protein